MFGHQNRGFVGFALNVMTLCRTQQGRVMRSSAFNPFITMQAISFLSTHQHTWHSQLMLLNHVSASCTFLTASCSSKYQGSLQAKIY